MCPPCGPLCTDCSSTLHMVIKIITTHAGTIENTFGTICCLSIGRWPKLFSISFNCTEEVFYYKHPLENKHQSPVQTEKEEVSYK